MCGCVTGESGIPQVVCNGVFSADMSYPFPIIPLLVPFVHLALVLAVVSSPVGVGVINWYPAFSVLYQTLRMWDMSIWLTNC